MPKNHRKRSQIMYDKKTKIENLREYVVKNNGCITSIQLLDGSIKYFQSSIEAELLKKILKLPEGWKLTIKNNKYFISNSDLNVDLPLYFYKRIRFF